MRVLLLTVCLVLAACVDGEVTGGVSTLADDPGPVESSVGTSTTIARDSTTIARDPTTIARDTSLPDGEASLMCWSAPVEPARAEGISFEDVSGAAELVDPLVGLHAHAAVLADLTGDQTLDLVVGTFGDRPVEAYQVRGAEGPNPDRLLSGGETFSLREGFSEELGRTSGAAVADLDADGDPDLVLVRNAGIRRQSSVLSRVFENVDGMITPKAEILPDGFLGRTPVVADFDSDGLVDLYVTEDRYGERGGVLLRNVGDLSFEDVTAGSGLEGVFALGAAAGDLDGDGLADLVTSDRIFRNRGDLTFEEETPTGFHWGQRGPEDDPAGVAIGDVDNDGRPDVVVGHHYRSTVEGGPDEAVRLFLQDGSGFREVTDEAGLVPLPTLAPHVGLADLDNDGWLDIVTSASAFEGEGPAVFRNSGKNPVSFEAPEGLGSLQYWVGAPVADVDKDGRLDVFAVEWEPSLPSRLFANTTSGGHWLELSVSGPGQGLGTVIEVETVDGDFLGRREIGVSGGYASGGPPYAHFGLGDHEVVDVRIRVPGASPVEVAGVAADRHLRWPDGC